MRTELRMGVVIDGGIIVKVIADTSCTSRAGSNVDDECGLEVGVIAMSMFLENT